MNGFLFYPMIYNVIIYFEAKIDLIWPVGLPSN